MLRHPLRALACAIALVLAAPAAASADITVDAFTLTPSTPAAGQAAQIDMHLEFSTSDAVKDLTIHLPAGLVGNPRAVGSCTQAQFAADPSGCPATAKVGTTSVGTTLTPVSGDVYNLEPSAGEPARLGVSLMGGQIKQTVLAALRSDGGLDTVIRDLPNKDPLLGLPLAVKSLDLSLDKRFMTNPTSCGTATASVDATSYGGAHGSRQTGFTTDRCDALAFAPQLTAEMDARGPAGAVHSPSVHTVIAVPAGNAATRATTVTLPSRMSVDVARVRAVCSVAQAAADTCPAQSTIGTVRADTPLLAAPLTGPVQLVTVPGQLLPGLRLALSGAVQLRLAGSLVLSSPMQTVFDGIPDTPLARLELTFIGGSPLKVTGDPCTGDVLRMSARFTGHNGAQATSPAQVKLLGCPVRGRARIAKGSRPALAVDVHKGRDAQPLKLVRVTLPRGLRLRGSVRAQADGKKRAAQHTGRTITLQAAGAQDVVLRAKARGRGRGTFRVDATRVDGKRFTLKLRASRLR